MRMALSKQRIMLFITGVLAITTLFASNFIRENARLKLYSFYKKTVPTLTNARACDELLKYYPIESEDFQSHIKKALLKYKAEHGKDIFGE